VKKSKTAQDKNTSTGLLVFASILTFIGLSYAAVPLYQTFCAGNYFYIFVSSLIFQVTGVGGTTRDKKGVVSLSEQNKNESRNKYPLQPLKIYFNADTK
jgi:cytochrome c oxidase assembly protein Cox11